MSQTSPVTETERDAERYRRLRVIGCAPAYTQHLTRNEVMRFTNLDAFVDEDIAAHPSRGEAKSGLAQTGQQQTGGDFYLVPREIIDQFPEINVNNYDHDDACALNAWGCEVVTNANPAFGPSDTSTDQPCPECEANGLCARHAVTSPIREAGK